MRRKWKAHMEIFDISSLSLIYMKTKDIIA